ncbi:hypothetical protein [Alteromonas sp. C1M14]|uniref:hypothetical protein n=1 Tax=Alteromonas sp. C1M14 TaxID=2841567 RepID=UPI001C09BE17|nr:hypothetical protein [Alteromonas sp. C1M14]MBU2977134.1 hypothetical protein [Alteromonas sp. C1M14]
MKKLMQYVMLVCTVNVSAYVAADEYSATSKPRSTSVSYQLDKKTRQPLNATSILPSVTIQQPGHASGSFLADANKPRLFKSLPAPVMSTKPQ